MDFEQDAFFYSGFIYINFVFCCQIYPIKVLVFVIVSFASVCMRICMWKCVQGNVLYHSHKRLAIIVSWALACPVQRALKHEKMLTDNLMQSYPGAARTSHDVQQRLPYSTLRADLTATCTLSITLTPFNLPWPHVADVF